MGVSVILILVGVGLHVVAGYFQFGRLNKYGVEEFSSYWGFLGKKWVEWATKTTGSIFLGLGMITGMVVLCSKH